MVIFNMLYSMLFNKCSRCHQGDVFVSKNPYNFSKMFQLHKHCSHCNLEYMPEPSFFYGALYVSYAISSGWFMIWYALEYTVLNWETITFAIFVMVFIVVVAPLTLRWSRLIWLNFFFKFKKEYKEHKQNNTQTTIKL